MSSMIWAALLLSSFASAKTFQNSYIRFNIPDNWNCNQEGIAWVCQPVSASESREAVIVATAKMAGPEDNLNSFNTYLRQPKTLITKSHSELSQPMKVEQTRLAGLDWISAVHLSSEIPNFTTHYLATVKDKLAVLISFSADHNSTSKYDPIFENAIRSIQVDSSKPNLVQNQAQGQVGPGGPNDSSNGSSAIGPQAGQGPQDPLTLAQQEKEKKKKILILALIGLGAVIALLIVRKLI